MLLGCFYVALDFNPILGFFFNLEIDCHNFIWTKLQNWNFDIFNLVYVDVFNISAHIYKRVWCDNKEINQGLS